MSRVIIPLGRINFPVECELAKKLLGDSKSVYHFLFSVHTALCHLYHSTNEKIFVKVVRSIFLFMVNGFIHCPVSTIKALGSLCNRTKSPTSPNQMAKASPASSRNCEMVCAKSVGLG